eukprot:IDg11232t1
MPSVTRGNGSVEYVSNAVKSWYIAHRGIPPPLIVFDMDPAPGNGAAAWRAAVGAVSSTWLQTVRLDVETVDPTRYTLNDSKERIQWRSKEARDYAAVLRECAARAVARGATPETLVLVVQDDVLFRQHSAHTRAWAKNAMKRGARTRTTRSGRVLPQRVCSASLFDMGGFGEAVLKSSNLVARFWRVKDAAIAASYFETHFDLAPIDWLADDWCRKKHAVVAAMRPSAVRHRGLVSSFSGNQRDKLLT